MGLATSGGDEVELRLPDCQGPTGPLIRNGGAIIACHYRATEWRHREIELAAHELLQLLDKASG
jgi:hypothetical protein